MPTILTLMRVAAIPVLVAGMSLHVVGREGWEGPEGKGLRGRGGKVIKEGEKSRVTVQ